MNPYTINLAPQKMQKKADNSQLVPRDASREISWSETDLERAFYAFGQNPDPIVRVKGLKIYREMMEDDQVKACIELRKQARLSVPWSIVPGEDGDHLSQEMAEYIMHVFKRLPGTVEDSLYEIYSAIEYGFSCTEIVYEILENGPFAGKVGLMALKTREPFAYDFKVDEHGNLLGLVYSGIKASFRSIMGRQSQSVQDVGRAELGTLENPFAPDKFIIYSYNSQFGNQYGRSDLIAAFRSWLSKKHVMKMWNVYLERYASPFIHAKTKAGTILKPEVLNDLDDFIKNLSIRSGFRSSDSVTLEAIMSGGAAASAQYEQAVEAHNRFIAHAVLCPNLLGYTQQQSTGSYALGKKHFDAFLWILEKMGRDTTETILGEQLIYRLVRMSYANVPVDLYPRFKFEGLEEESIEARARIIAMLTASGLVDSEEPWIREFLTLPKKEMQKGQPKKGAAKKKAFEEPSEKIIPEPAHSDIKMQERISTEFEKKIRVKEFEADLNMVEEALFSQAEEVLIGIRDNLLAFIERRKILQSGDPKAVEAVDSAINVGPLKDLLKRWLSKAHLDSKLRAFEELGRAGIETEIVRRFQAGEQPMEPWEPLPPVEAVDFFNRKVKATIKNKDGKKVLIELGNRRELTYYDEKAFAVSGVVRDDLLGDVKQVLLNGIKKQDPAGATMALKDLFNRYIKQGVAVDDELLAPHRLRTIVNTNLADAVNNGRRAMYEDQDVREFIQFFQYSAVLDENTTDYCRCMDQKIFRAEQLSSIIPPAHYNCRSFTVPITQFEIDELKAGGEGVDISQPCPDRASGFADVTREPMSVLLLPSGEKGDFPAPEKVEVPDPSPAASDREATDRLRRELAQMIARCPYIGCSSPEIVMTRKIFNIWEFQCNTCRLPFRVSNKGDLYLYDAGMEKWERASLGIFPKYFTDKLLEKGK